MQALQKHPSAHIVSYYVWKMCQALWITGTLCIFRTGKCYAICNNIYATCTKQNFIFCSKSPQKHYPKLSSTLLLYMPLVWYVNKTKKNPTRIHFNWLWFSLACFFTELHGIKALKDVVAIIIKPLTPFAINNSFPMIYSAIFAASSCSAIIELH